MRTVIPITDAQRAALRPFFELIKRYNAIGIPCAIGAQCFPDGISLKVFYGEKAETLANALGGGMTDICHTAEDHIIKGLKRDTEMPNE